MKYYKLVKDLPTFKKGELFTYVDAGFTGLRRLSDGTIAYASSTIKKFPNILKDWFVEVPPPERDSKTKYAFMEYISDHREERFFQAVRNFAREYLGDDFNFIYASKRPLDDYIQHYDKFCDTFYLECDELLEAK